MLNNIFYIKKTIEYKIFSILFGIIYLKLIYSQFVLQIRLFGFHIFTINLNKKCSIQIALKIPLPFKFKNKIQANYIYEFIKNNYSESFDSIYCLNGAPSGEIYLILNMIDLILRKNNSKKPLFLVDKPFKQQLCTLLCPDIPVILNKTKIELYFNNLYSYKIKECIIYNFFPTVHYINQDILINSNKEHYFSYIKSALNIEEKPQFKDLDISDTAKQNVLSIIEENNLDKFIIICPEANTCEENHINWNKICEIYFDLGYKIVLNISNFKNYIPHTIPLFLPYEEMFLLTQKANALIGLRSGLIEILSQCSKTTIFHIFYTNFPKRGALKAMDAEKALNGFSLIKLPNINIENIFEYNANELANDDILIKKMALHRLV